MTFPVFNSPARWVAVLLLAAVPLFITGLSGCATGDDTSFESLLGDDDQLASEIMDRIQDDPITSRQGLGVRVNKGKATLYGAVPSEQIRARAVSIVRNTPGVTDVDDRIQRY
jgi:hypothetical protein